MKRKTGKMLIVEDDVLSSFMMQELCEALELNAEIVASAEECLGRLSQTPEVFDLVLMDIHMPRLSGADATRHVRTLDVDPPRTIPIVAMTADQKWSSAALRRQYGLDGYLSKPIKPDELLKVCSAYST